MTLKPAMNKDVIKNKSVGAYPNAAAGKWLNPVSEVGIGKKSKGKI